MPPSSRPTSARPSDGAARGPRPACPPRRLARLAGRRLRRARGRRDGAARAQRRRQDDHAARAARPRPGRGAHHLRRRGDHERADAPDRSPRRRLRPRGPRCLLDTDGRGEPATRAPQRQRPVPVRLRALPRAEAARCAGGGHALGRAAADARDRSRAAEREPHPPRRRADEGPRAAARDRGRTRARARLRGEHGAARRAEPRRRAPGRRARRRARHRARRARWAGTRAARRPRQGACLAWSCMSTVVLLIITGFGLGAMYFLIASGLSLIYGLMGVLNFAHGAFLTVGSYATWYTETKLGGISVAPSFVLAAIVGLAVWTVFAELG